MKRNPIYVFKDGGSTGIFDVPVDSIVQVVDIDGNDNPSMTQIIDKIGLWKHSTIDDYLLTPVNYRNLDGDGLSNPLIDGQILSSLIDGTRIWIDNVSGSTYFGTWDASTNTPTIIDGTGANGNFYKVSVAGAQDLGSGLITFAIGDTVIYNGIKWEKIVSSGGRVDTVQAGTNVTIDDTDPINPIVSSTDTDTVYDDTALDTRVATNATAIATKEDALLVPTIDGDVLSSTIAGVRSWITPTVTAVINDLTTGGTTDALSAEQGKILETSKEDILPTQATAADMVLNRNAGVDTWVTPVAAVTKATQIEVDAGTDDTKFVTSLTLENSDKWNDSVVSLAAGAETKITSIVSMTQAAYNALGTYQADKIYFIKG